MSAATTPELTSPTVGSVRRVMALSKPVSGRLVLACVLGALSLGSGVGLLATSAWLISRASEQPPVLFLQVAVVGVRAFALGRAVFRYAERLVSHDAAFRTLTDMRVAIYNKLADNGPVALRPYRRGDLLSRLVADVDTVQDLSLRVLVPVVSGLLVGMGSVALALWLLPSAGVVLAIMLLLGGLLVPWLTARAGSAAAQRLAPVQGRMTAEVVDLFSGSADVLACNAGTRMVNEVAQTDAEFTALQRRGAMSLGVAAALSAAAQGAAIIAMIFVAVPAVRSGSLDGVNLAVVVLLPLAAYEAVLGLPAAALALLRVRSAADRVFEVTDAEPAVHEASDPKPLPAPGVAGRTLEFDGMSARYPDGDEDAISDLTLRTSSGHCTALVGPSGAGKSTVANVAERFLDYSGSVRLDGAELRALDSDEVRTVVGLCAQDAHIFDTTIGENVHLARRSATDEEIWSALETARLAQWVKSLPQGLNTPVGMHGTALSGGQRQRIALARALLARFEVLVLDEPTEHLDPPTAAALMADVRAATADCATILITHRPADTAYADEVVAVRSH